VAVKILPKTNKSFIVEYICPAGALSRKKKRENKIRKKKGTKIVKPETNKYTHPR
jgi:hypothetical protein